MKSKGPMFPFGLTNFPRFIRNVFSLREDKINWKWNCSNRWAHQQLRIWISNQLSLLLNVMSFRFEGKMRCRCLSCQTEQMDEKGGLCYNNYGIMDLDKIWPINFYPACSWKKPLLNERLIYSKIVVWAREKYTPIRVDPLVPFGDAGEVREQQPRLVRLEAPHRRKPGKPTYEPPQAAQTNLNKWWGTEMMEARHAVRCETAKGCHNRSVLTKARYQAVWSGHSIPDARKTEWDFARMRCKTFKNI